MRKIFGVVGALALVIALSGCATDSPSPSSSTSNSSSANQTPDASLIPPAPGKDVKAVDPSLYDTGYSEYLFRAGTGPAWCTINAEQKWVLCEQNEASAQYKPVTVPSSCDGSYGYQIKLWESTPTDGTDTAGFVCASGLYNDGSVAPALNSGEKVTVGQITCYVADTVVRCDNQNGQYIALGAQVWAAKN
jgi:hypothetical protein